MSRSGKSREAVRAGEYAQDRAALGNRRAKRKAEKAAKDMRKREEELPDEAYGSCSRKVRYKTKSEALSVASMRTKRKLSAYRCKYCGGWHLTSHPIQDIVDDG